MASAAIALVWVALCAPLPARAWNPLEALGRLLGRPFGSFIEAATTPSIENLEGSGGRLIDRLDGALQANVRLAGETVQTALGTTDRLLERRIGQIDRAAENRLSQADQVVKARIGQADAVLAARIMQIDASANQLVDRTLGQLDAISRRRIAQLGREARSTIVLLDAKGQERLKQADGILQQRVDQLGRVAEKSIAQVDEALRQRLVQLDEITEQRAGNLDVIATKQGLNLQRILLQVASIVALLAFVVYVLRKIYTDFVERWARRDTAGMSWRRRVGEQVKVSGNVAGWTLVRLLVGGACVAVIYGFYTWAPLGPQRRVDELVATHRGAFEQALAQSDFTRVRYHASQLGILDPAREHEYRAAQLKAELIRKTLTQPGLLRTNEGVRELVGDVQRVVSALGNEAETDPDLLAIQAHISWQAASDRGDERSAAVLAARALAAARREPPPTFTLRPIAINYLRSFLHNPLPLTADEERDIWTIAALRGELDRVGDRDLGSHPLRPVFEYDGLVRALDVEASAAYVAMVEAHARYLAARQGRSAREPEPLLDADTRKLDPAAAELVVAKRERLAAASALIESWRVFDRALTSDPWLAGTSTVLAALLLDDAPLSHALYIEAAPDAAELPARIADIGDAQLRARSAPVRVEWVRRYVNGLSEDAQRLVAFEEARRFAAFEQNAHAFEQALAKLRMAEANARTGQGDQAALPPLRFEAALRAGELGLYAGTGAERAPYAFRVLGPGGSEQERTQIRAAYRQRQLRLL